MSRRRSVTRKFKEKPQPEQVLKASLPEFGSADKVHVQDTPAAVQQARKEGGLPLAVILEILSVEYEEGRQGEALCRAAVRLAEECGEIDRYRARWDVAQEDSSGSQPVYLFDRRQARELIGYHQRKGNTEALKKEKDKLRITEGRLLLGQSPPLKVTGDDLEKLEEFIRGQGF